MIRELSMLLGGTILGVCFTALFLMRLAGRGWKIEFEKHSMTISKDCEPIEETKCPPPTSV